MSRSYDVAVIGGGPGGYVAAIRLAQLGKKVVIIEKNEFGGTCTNKGCIPTKALLTAAHLYRDIKEKSSKFGIKVSDLEYEISGIMKHMKKSVMLSRKGIEFLLKKNNVDVIKNEAKLKDRETIVVKDEEIHAKNIVLAQGSKAIVFPPFDAE